MAVKNFLKFLKKIPPFYVFIAITIIGIAILVPLISVRASAAKTGKTIGRTTGLLVGRGVGTISGVTTGINEGREAGKKDGLSAEDITVTIKRAMQNTVKLEVLVAGVKFHDILKSGKDYAALYMLGGNIVFTVDLCNPKVTESEEEICVYLPSPEMELYIDQSKIERKAEYIKWKYAGDAEDGFDTFINSMKKIGESSKEELSNYDELFEMAKISARTQVEALVRSLRIEQKTVTIKFLEGDTQ